MRRLTRANATQTATVTSKGQITIPKRVRETLGLGPGDQVTFEGSGRGAVVLKRRQGTSPFAQWRGYLRHLHGKDVDRLVNEMRGR
jgi:AbrB family looped-hinge helix DNA binding protein